MCIAFFALSLPGYKLVLASNRDEFIDRPTLPAQWHDFDASIPEGSGQSTVASEGRVTGSVLSGLDRGKQEGGTWLGITRDLRVGLLTNVRLTPPAPPLRPARNPPSRGLLLKSFLSPHPPPPPSSSPEKTQGATNAHGALTPELGVHDYLASYLPTAGEYEGFNLLLFSLGRKGVEPEVGYLTNRPVPSFTDLQVPHTRRAQTEREHDPVADSNHLNIKSGSLSSAQCFGLSNSPMSQPWPKVVDGEKRMVQTLKEWNEAGRGDERDLVERMFKLLSHQVPVTSPDLSHTTTVPLLDVPSELPNNASRGYGTRTATVILVKEDGKTTFVERDVLVLDDKGEARRGDAERWYEFEAEI
ncbi:hypothetical protein IAR55_000762 [Kwoniella newhampshirensis]|uniref:NRDE protein-domain-containing protein n=1 Tax=Kwoniella newhampshirensis TaxID=1651941 RepID=A0AAW0Z3T2_9TREE